MSCIRLVAAVAIAFSFVFPAQMAFAADACTIPGVTLITDAVGDQTAAAVVPADYDLNSVAISEALTPGAGSALFIEDGKRRLIFTYKVGALENLPPMTRWLFFFNGPSRSTTDAPAVQETFFVGMTNFPDQGTVFLYGAEATLNGTSGFDELGFAEAGSNYNVDGTITMVVPLDKFGFAPGAVLSTFKANVVQSIGAATAGYLAGPIVDSGAGTTPYTTVAANACGPEGGGGADAVVRAAGAGDPAFTLYPSTGTLSADLFGAGEPTLDVNYKTGSVFMRFILGVTRTVFNDASSPPTATWTDVTDPIDGLTSIPGLDPFLGGSYLPDADGKPDTTKSSRIFSLQLLGAMSAMVYSDDDGETWTPAQGGGQVHGADNQSIAAGPYPAGFLLGPVVLSDFAVYYCSQGTINAFCSRSDDGGMTFKNSFPIFPVDGLCGNHGHVKVGPDGTVYVPMNNPCLGAEGVTLSIDGGITWTYITVPETAGGRWDSSIAIARDGKTVYYAYAEEGSDEPMVIKGTLIKTPVATIQWDERGAANVGTPAGLKNIVFSTMVAGDKERAAVIFHGTTTAGDSGAPAAMAGALWHLYAATTTDGGASWALRNLTLADPTQKGAICDDGVACTGNTRNLLDFMDAVIDGQGRIVIAFADGCTGNCVPGGGAANNDAFGTLARQSGGPRMYKAFDPVVTEPLPLTASLAATRYSKTADAQGRYEVSEASPLMVDFLAGTANGNGTPLTYTLVAGDGSAPVTQSSVNFTHSYTLAGPHRAYVVARQSNGNDSATSNEIPVTTYSTVVVNPGSTPARAELKLDLPSGNVAPVTVSFDTRGSTGTAYTLDFGDGDSAQTPNQVSGTGVPPAAITHRYASPGNYQAQLTMTGDQPSSATATVSVTIAARQQLTAQLSVSPSTVVAGDNETPVTLDGSRSVPANGKTLSDYRYAFDFGDGTVVPAGDARSASHVYAQAGTYEPRLTVTDKTQAGVSSEARAQMQSNPLRGSNVTTRDLSDQNFITVSTKDGVVRNLVPVATPASADPALRYPVGFVRFNIGNVPADGKAEIVITLPRGVVADGYLKCAAGTCSQMPGVRSEGNLLRFTLEDGGIGDEDGVKNGVIVDPGAPTLGGVVVAPGSQATVIAKRGGALNLGLLLCLMLAAGFRIRQNTPPA